MAKTYKYNIKDLNGNPVPDSKATPVMRDSFKSTGDYNTDCKRNVRAYSADNKTILLKDIPRDKVRFVAGLWRVQKTLEPNVVITNVRDKRFILGEKINHFEKNLFEYYYAAEVCENCYGVMDPSYIYIVAKYDTDNGPMWSYGFTIEQARAFLGIALFDKHIDMIHNSERKNFTRQK